MIYLDETILSGKITQLEDSKTAKCLQGFCMGISLSTQVNNLCGIAVYNVSLINRTRISITSVLWTRKKCGILFSFLAFS